MLNSVILIGRLTADPELRYIPSTGKAVTTFTLAIDRGYKDSEGKNKTDFLRVQVWDKAAENCANYLSKGLMACVQGAINIENYTDKDGNKRTSTQIRANLVKFLEFKNKSQGDNTEYGYDYMSTDGEDAPF